MKYSLNNGRLALTFNTLGGELISLKSNSELEYIWNGNNVYWGGHAPVLFPVVGSLRGKRALADGNKLCHMERHGIARISEFEMMDRTQNTITFALQSNSKTIEQFPFDFELTIHYRLDDTEVVTEYTVSNKGKEAMPYQIGGHPGFNCPLLDDEAFERYIVEFEQVETADCYDQNPETGIVNISEVRRMLDHTDVLPMNHALFKSGALIFDRLKSKKVRLYNPIKGHGIQLEFSDFDNLLIWSSMNGGPFVALEPWNGLPTCSDEGDIFEEKRGVRILQPHECHSLSYKTSIF